MASEAHADTETERECACLAYVWNTCVAIVQLYGPVSGHNSKTDFLSAFIDIIVCVFLLAFVIILQLDSARWVHAWIYNIICIAPFARWCCAFFLLLLYRIRARFFFSVVYQSYIWRVIDLFHLKERKLHYTLTNQIQLHIDMHFISVFLFALVCELVCVFSRCLHMKTDILHRVTIVIWVSDLIIQWLNVLRYGS